MPPPHYNVFCGCLYASCIVVITSYDADVSRSNLSLHMHTSRPLVEHQMKEKRKGLRSDSPPELKEVGVASTLELLSVSTLYIASILGLTCRCDRRSNSHPRCPPPYLPQVSKPKPEPPPSHTIQQHTPEIHLRSLIVQTTSSTTTSLHPTYLTLRSAL